jgi:hypothetical protein
MADDDDFFATQKSVEEPKAKRVRLKTYDLVPAQALNSMGVSRVESISLDNLYDMVRAGNKAVAYFSELADKDPARIGVGISRMAQVMIAFIDRLKSDVAKKVLNEKLLKECMEEADTLREHLMKLDGGMRHEGGSKSLKYGLDKTKVVSAAEVSAAAEKVHDWLFTKESKLRAVLSFMSGGGIFYVAACHEKTARAFAKKDLSKTKFIEAAKARMTGGEAAEDDADDMSALRD